MKKHNTGESLLPVTDNNGLHLHLGHLADAKGGSHAMRGRGEV